MRMKVAVAVIMVMGLLSVVAYRSLGPESKLTIATSVGTPYMVGVGMAEMINRFVPRVEATVQDYADEGEVLQRLSQGKADLALVEIPAIARTFPTAQARGKAGLRFVMGGHAALVLHTMVRQDSDIQTIAQLKGKKLAVQEQGGDGEALAQAALDAYQLSSADVQTLHLPLMEQVQAFKEGTVDAVVIAVPLPSPGLSSPGPVGVTKTGPTRLLSLGEAEVQRLLAAHPGYSRHVIEVGTYQDQAHEILTVSRKNALVTHKNLGIELVYQIVQAILEHPDEFQKVCPLAVAYTSKKALPGSSLIPMHRGAERYLGGKGIL
ncbi:MAG: TAXI family TRAP transporter solute-binding subunit [Nitrospinae bacterium]|nr:TAXI family TRAP transporter solute-binding subunit [Nitrospinota bacterium]